MATTLLARMLVAANRVSSRIHGGDIIYRRGGVAVGDAFPATLGQTEFQADDGNVVRLEHTDADFVFPKTCIAAYYPPQKGDTIQDVDSGAVFEVLAPDRKQCYRDLAGVLIRVHTKKFG